MIRKTLNAMKIYTQPNMIGLLGLGFASGLPRLLVYSTLAFWLLEEGVSITAVGLFAATALPYTLKFLWAPAIDRFQIAFAHLDTRRTWITIFQVAVVASLFALSVSDPANSPANTAIASLLLAFSSASLDIVIDAYRVELLPDEDQGAGAAAAVMGYRIGMIAASAGALYLAEYFSWSVAYQVMAGLAAVPIIVTFVMPSVVKRERELSWTDAVLGPFRQLSERFGSRLLLILLFIIVFKLGDALAGAMTNPLLHDLKFSKTTIADVAKTFGIVCSILGVIVGGVLVRKGIDRALLVSVIIQSISNLGFVALVFAGNSTAMLVVAIAIENVSGGIGTAAFVAYLSSLCKKEFTATQYAFLTATASTLKTATASFSGFAVAEFGYATYFVITAFVSLPALILLRFLREPRPG